MNCIYSEEKLNDIFLKALELFNECIESDISAVNTVLAFFIPQTGQKIYESFCGEFFSKYLNEPYDEKGFFESFAAQAFVGEDRYGILFRSDLDFCPDEILYTFLHEISHLYCTRNEISGGRFFDRYCMGYMKSREEDGQMNAGYAVWREFVADLMASSILEETTEATLNSVKQRVLTLYDSISGSNPDSKKCMSLILVYVMNTIEIGCTSDWEEAEKALCREYRFDGVMLYMVKIIFEHLQQSPFWRISPAFIMELGGAYLSVLSTQTLKKLRF